MAEILRKNPLSSMQKLRENTTLGVVATNTSFDKAALQKIAQMSHDGLARAIVPVHLPTDGDTIFSLSTGEVKGHDLGQVGALAADVISQAVVRAILQARGIPGYPDHFQLLSQ